MDMTKIERVREALLRFVARYRDASPLEIDKERCCLATDAGLTAKERRAVMTEELADQIADRTGG